MWRWSDKQNVLLMKMSIFLLFYFAFFAQVELFSSWHCHPPSLYIIVNMFIVMFFRVLTTFSISQFAQSDQQYLQLPLRSSQRFWQWHREFPERRARIRQRLQKGLTWCRLWIFYLQPGLGGEVSPRGRKKWPGLLINTVFTTQPTPWKSTLRYPWTIHVL